MAQRESKKPTNFEKCYHILEYLKKHTDSEHKTTQAKLRTVPELKEYIKDKGAFNDAVNAMADAMNMDDYGPKPQEEWRLVFDAFTQQYGDNWSECRDGGGLPYDKKRSEDTDSDILIWEVNDERRPVKNLYYQQPFSYDEVNAIIEGLRFSKMLDTKTANALVQKVEKHLTNDFYTKGAKNICTIYEPSLMDIEMLRENLRVIQKAIDHRVRIAFYFCAYDHEKKIKKLRAKKDVLSPYYLVANSGRYYLLACMEWNNREDSRRQMSIWRVDLMRDIEIPEFDEKLGKKGIPSLKKSEVQNLPEQWNEKFALSHLNMAFDEPVMITLRISSPKEEGYPELHKRPDYTFMHDWFGDTFQYIGTDKEDTGYDIVRVRCSPYAMTNWALQYSDRVEVLSPESVRNAVKIKVENLTKKYV